MASSAASAPACAATSQWRRRDAVGAGGRRRALCSFPAGWLPVVGWACVLVVVRLRGFVVLARGRFLPALHHHRRYFRCGRRAAGVVAGCVVAGCVVVGCVELGCGVLGAGVVVVDVFAGAPVVSVRPSPVSTAPGWWSTGAVVPSPGEEEFTGASAASAPPARGPPKPATVSPLPASTDSIARHAQPRARVIG